MVKYKLAYALSVAAMTLGSGVLAPAVFADGVTEVDTFAGLEAALASGGTVKLTSDIQASFASDLGDVVHTHRLKLDGVNATLDLNGHSIEDNGGTECKTFNAKKKQYTATTCNMFELSNHANLTVTGSGAINAGRYAFSVGASDLVLNGATISATSPQAYGVYVFEGGSATINSGSITADYAAFAGNNVTGDMNFYVNGGTLSSVSYPAIYMPGQVYLTMTGGTLNGGIVARIGQIEISGGTVNGQSDYLSNDGLDKNAGGMPSMREGIALIAGGKYKSNNTEFGNGLALTVKGEAVINDGINLYDLGYSDEGYEQNVTVKLEDGVISSFDTKFTNETIGFTPSIAYNNASYVAGNNNANGRIDISISGGTFKTEPAEDEIADDKEAEQNADGAWEVLPKETNMADNGAMDSDGTKGGALYGSAVFNQGFVTDRKAYFELSTLNDDEIEALILDSTLGGDLILPFDASLLSDRNGTHVIEGVENTSITIRVTLTEEQYNSLKNYNAVKVACFGEDGKEFERFDAVLGVDGDSYYIEFTTTHLSTYGVVGVNEETTAVSATPETGTMTAQGASAANAAIVTAVAVGLLTSIISFTYLIRRR